MQAGLVLGGFEVLPLRTIAKNTRDLALHLVEVCSPFSL